MKHPNFFIVGAPKTGTTALTEYLRLHPDVFMTSPKEPHVFAEDLPGYRATTDEAEYLKLYEPAPDTAQVLGEASVFYLYSHTAPQRLREFAPGARLLAMFRDPLEVVHAMHGQLLYSRDETVGDLTTAWSLIPERKAGRQIPRHCRAQRILFYDEMARFGSQLERLYQFFPRDQVKVVFFDDFRADTAAVYRDVLDFLGLPDDQRTDFKPVNERKRHRNPLVAEITQRSNPRVSRVLAAVKRTLGIERIGLTDSLRRMNVEHGSRPPLDPVLAERIRAHYADEVRLLGQLTGRDLSHWTDARTVRAAGERAP